MATVELNKPYLQKRSPYRQRAQYILDDTLIRDETEPLHVSLLLLAVAPALALSTHERFILNPLLLADKQTICTYPVIISFDVAQVVFDEVAYVVVVGEQFDVGR